MTAENPNRAALAVLPEDLELTPAAQPVEVPPPDVSAAEAAEDRGALAFLRVFRHRNYRLFFSGQLVSLMGTWITNVTQGYLVYSLTHSPLLLGVVSFAGQVPVFFLAPFGGMISDRLDRRRMLLMDADHCRCVDNVGGAGGPGPDPARSRVWHGGVRWRLF